MAIIRLDEKGLLDEHADKGIRYLPRDALHQDALKEQGFEILEAYDLSAHLKNSYLRLADRTPKFGGPDAEHYAELTNAYRETARAVDNQELGWGLFICQK